MLGNRGLTFILCLALVLAALAAYSNHFQNGFHFDDFHTVTGNPAIRDLRNLPRFFTDASTFSTYPDHRTWRPLTSVTLAIDYRLGRGLVPFWFHLSTFVAFEALLVLAFLLFRHIMDAADPHPSNVWAAFAAAACHGLHPAAAETVNYVIQRADIYSTLGMVAGLVCFAAFPAQRRWCWYLLPAIAGFIAKPPVVIFGFLLAYAALVDEKEHIRWSAAIRSAIPAAIATAAATLATLAMTPKTFVAGADSPWLYRLTQPWVALHYFKSFFVPTELNADSDWTPVTNAFTTEAVAGYLFLAALLWTGWRAAQYRQWRPAAFGIAWFLLALAPTSWVPLAEVTNDHRMFFPFVGLALAAAWTLRQSLMTRLAGSVAWRWVLAAAMCTVLAAEGIGTRERNRVWSSDELLWRDVVTKSPRNGRGLNNYGLIFLARADYTTALAYFERALQFAPNYWPLADNLAITSAALHRDAEAERQFQRALALAPNVADPHFYYGRWLFGVGRTAEALTQLEIAVRMNDQYLDARELLARLRAQPPPLPPQPHVHEVRTPEQLLALSLAQFQAGRYNECIAAAKQAIALKPDYAEAYNNVAAGYNALHQWDDGIRAAREAIRLKPDYELAKNNLAWSISQKAADK